MFILLVFLFFFFFKLMSLNLILTLGSAVALEEHLVSGMAMPNQTWILGGI